MPRHASCSWSPGHDKSRVLAMLALAVLMVHGFFINRPESWAMTPTWHPSNRATCSKPSRDNDRKKLWISVSCHPRFVRGHSQPIWPPRLTCSLASFKHLRMIRLAFRLFFLRFLICSGFFWFKFWTGLFGPHGNENHIHSGLNAFAKSLALRYPTSVDMSMWFSKPTLYTLPPFWRILSVKPLVAEQHTSIRWHLFASIVEKASTNSSWACLRSAAIFSRWQVSRRCVQQNSQSSVSAWRASSSNVTSSLMSLESSPPGSLRSLGLPAVLESSRWPFWSLAGQGSHIGGWRWCHRRGWRSSWRWLRLGLHLGLLHLDLVQQLLGRVFGCFQGQRLGVQLRWCRFWILDQLLNHILANWTWRSVASLRTVNRHVQESQLASVTCQPQSMAVHPGVTAPFETFRRVIPLARFACRASIPQVCKLNPGPVELVELNLGGLLLFLFRGNDLGYHQLADLLGHFGFQGRGQSFLESFHGWKDQDHETTCGRRWCLRLFNFGGLQRVPIHVDVFHCIRSIRWSLTAMVMHYMNLMYLRLMLTHVNTVSHVMSCLSPNPDISFPFQSWHRSSNRWPLLPRLRGIRTPGNSLVNSREGGSTAIVAPNFLRVLIPSKIGTPGTSSV